MTEADWLSCPDPIALLDAAWVLAPARGHPRRDRLAACAAARRAWHLLDDERRRAAVEAAERFGDGLISKRELFRANRAALGAFDIVRFQASQGGTIRPAYAARAAFDVTADPVDSSSVFSAVAAALCPAGELETAPEYQHLLRVARDVFGNPFRRFARDPLWPRWDGGAIVRLAQDLYDSRAYEQLPVLADALEDAGCCEAELLGHLRSGGPHVRGCWALDLVLGKA